LLFRKREKDRDRLKLTKKEEKKKREEETTNLK